MEHWKTRPDHLHKLAVGDSEFLFNAKYDSLHRFAWLKAYMLKVSDDEYGMVGFWLEPEEADWVIESADMPVTEREYMYDSEKESYLLSRDARFDWENRLDETVPEPYEILTDGEIVEIDHGTD